MKVSVALAAYNGEKYIGEQLSSILSQIGQNDEIIVSDDNPSGNTKAAIDSLGDGRIKYFEGPARGVCANFEFALSKCDGDIIFLCDQDDVWLPDKVKDVKEKISLGYELVLHDASVTDEKLNIETPSFFALHKSNTSLIGNIIRNSFVGCCMAFTKQVAQSVTPFPGDLPMHDWWIALAAMKKGFRIALINKPLILWRRHSETFTGGKTTLKQKITWRIKIIGYLIPLCHGKDQ